MCLGINATLPTGLAVLLRIREAVISSQKHARTKRESLPYDVKTADKIIQRCLTPHFGASSLQTRQISWSSMPASMFDYVSRHEAVHPTKRISDFRRRFGKALIPCSEGTNAVADKPNHTNTRIGPGRRCFGLFHTSFHEPLAFVHVALTPHIVQSLNEIR